MTNELPFVQVEMWLTEEEYARLVYGNDPRECDHTFVVFQVQNEIGGEGEELEVRITASYFPGGSVFILGQLGGVLCHLRNRRLIEKPILVNVIEYGVDGSENSQPCYVPFLTYLRRYEPLLFPQVPDVILWTPLSAQEILTQFCYSSNCFEVR